MSDSELYDYLTDISKRLEVFSCVLRMSVDVVSNAHANRPGALKFMLDNIICDELAVMAAAILDDISDMEEDY